jgi:hypothetical protein
VAQVHSIHNPFTAEEVETGLMGLVKWNGSAAAASRYLKDTGKLDVSPQTLGSWKQTHAIRFDELREKYKDEVEATLAHEMRDVAALAVAGTRLAVEKTMDALESGDEDDPARAAANLSKVATSSTDKLMTLTSRPAVITENRSLNEIIRSLIAKKVLNLPDEPDELPAGTPRSEET